MEQALIGALNLVSRNLPLPPELFNTVSSICYGSEPKPLPLNSDVFTHNFLTHFCLIIDYSFFYYSQFSLSIFASLILQVDASNSTQDDDLLTELQDALSKQRPNFSSSSKLNKAMQIRTQSRIQNRLTQLEGYQFYFNKLLLHCVVCFVVVSYNLMSCTLDKQLNLQLIE
jgi:SWI/SNF-related matrix-associated actin-dependent regulator of chromatin subfamily A protein 2/4